MESLFERPDFIEEIRNQAKGIAAPKKQNK
jgi:hypothetical protein